ncbi:MAG TPA: hypothetical protein VGB00_18655 [Pyrinomonadaceae bacterium]
MELTEKEVIEHLEGFVKSFVLPEFQHRWNHFLFEKPGKARFEMVKFYGHHNPAFCKIVKSRVVFENFVKIRGDLTGIYFDGDEPAKRIKVSEVEELMGCEAVFSIKAGKLALLLTHEFEVFLCEKALKK